MIKLKRTNKCAFDENDEFIVFNAVTYVAIESQPTEEKAVHAVEALNSHNERIGILPCYQYSHKDEVVFRE